MATQLDGFDVEVGDTVLDLNFGGGTVLELTGANSFRVHFAATKQTFAYDTGVRVGSGARRTLYWHDPIVMTPPKDPLVWDGIRAAIQGMSESFRRVVFGD